MLFQEMPVFKQGIFKRIANEVSKWGKVIREAGIKAE